MAKNKFEKTEWGKITELIKNDSDSFGLPERRDRSVVLGTFNVRELGKVGNRSKEAWDFIADVCKRFDLLAIQEVADDMEGIRHIKAKLGNDYGLAVSDVTGVFPGDTGNPERLAFLFNWKRIERTELASDITYDRSKVVQTLFGNRARFRKTWDEYLEELGGWEEKKKQAKAAGKKSPSRPAPVLPVFLTFIRQPHCASFRIKGAGGEKPVEFLAVNAHLLYGTDTKVEDETGEGKTERLLEFNALVDWLAIRAKQKDKLYHQNILMMGDCNLEFEDIDVKRQSIDDRLRALNTTKLKSKRAAKVNFPLLTKHPTHGELKTSARKKDTYDQIAMFTHDDSFPTYDKNANAGQSGKDGYDYGVFDFSELVSKALYNSEFDRLNDADTDYVFKRVKQEISDHMPAWIRLPIPGA